MNLFKKIIGTILYLLSHLISEILNVFIKIITFTSNILSGFSGIVVIGGFLLLFILGPFAIVLLMNPMVLMIILVFVVFPILGTKFVSYLKYLKYIITEYLFDKANYFKEGKERDYKSFNEYGNRYRRMEEDRKRKEQQQRQYEQQKIWEERFRQWNEYQNSQRGYSGYDYGKTYANPTIEFKNKFEKSCDILGIGYDADKYQIKLAYRKKAKEYHPDLNKAANATEMFQQINAAYEFLSDANIERYEKYT